MRYAGIIKNDINAGNGICVSLFVQGCNRKCKGCHNPETWDFKGGFDYTPETQKEILKALGANGIKRNLCLMGGEPLEKENIIYLKYLTYSAKEQYKDLKIYLWTGYDFKDIKENANFLDVDYVIDGPYIEELRDITLKWRGSSNQNIWERKNNEWINITK